MIAPVILAAAAANSGKGELSYVWSQATLEAKIIILCLAAFSIIAWSVMIFKAVQMRRANKLNRFFNSEFRSQKGVLEVYDRRVQADGRVAPRRDRSPSWPAGARSHRPRTGRE